MSVLIIGSNKIKEKEVVRRGNLISRHTGSFPSPYPLIIPVIVFGVSSCPGRSSRSEP